MIVPLILLAHNNTQRPPPQLNRMLQRRQLSHGTNQTRILTLDSHFLLNPDIGITIAKHIFSFIMDRSSWASSECMGEPVAQAEAGE